MEEINKVHHKDWMLNDLPDKCANLILADPPYFEVKGAFDFIWSDMKAYLQDVEKWCLECKRLLADHYAKRSNFEIEHSIRPNLFYILNHKHPYGGTSRVNNKS